MSTLLSEKNSIPIESEKDLSDYFRSFSKDMDHVQVGLEAEFFGVDHATGRAIPYEGYGGVHHVLKNLTESFGYAPLLEDGAIIGLKKGPLVISLEPGGQVELSAPPVENVFEIEEQLKSFLKELAFVSREISGLRWLAVGIHPFSSIDEIPWVPKKRYKIMAEYFDRAEGNLSCHMMKRTATNQINFDYSNEEHAMESMRVALSLTSIVTALFANSSFSGGRPNGFISRRLDIWNHTDPSRTGLIAEFTRPGRTFRDYADYLLDMPMIFTIRNGDWHPLTRMTFRQFIRKEYNGAPATVGDFELHLSTAFPEVRLKQYLEIRGADAQPPELTPALAAFWKGILYDFDTMREAWKLVSFASEEDRLNLHRSVPKLGLEARLGAKPILPIARELVELSCASLGRQIKTEDQRDECLFMDRIRETILRCGKSPAVVLIEKWRDEFQQDPRRLIDYLSVG